MHTLKYNKYIKTWNIFIKDQNKYSGKWHTNVWYKISLDRIKRRLEITEEKTWAVGL